MDTKLNALKISSKKVIHKADEATDQFLGNKITDKIVKTKSVIDENLRSVKKNNYSTRKERRIKTRIIKVEHCKMSKLLNDSTISKFLKKKKKWIEVNDLSSHQYSVNKNIRFKTLMLRSDLCDYSDTYIFVTGAITVELDNDANL